MVLLPLIFNGTLACVNKYVTTLRNKLPLKMIAETPNSTTISPTINMTALEFRNKQEVWSYYSEILDTVQAIQIAQKKRNILLCNLFATSLFIIGWVSYLSLVSSKESYLIITNPFILNIIQWLLKIVKSI